MTSIALRRLRAWGALLAAVSIIAGAGLVASPAFAAGPVYVVDGDIQEITSGSGSPGWNWGWGEKDWDIQDDGLHFSIDGHGARFHYVTDGHRYASLEEIMNFLEGSGITVTQGELQWVCLGVELTMPLLPSPSPEPSSGPSPSLPPGPGSTVEIELCFGPAGVGATNFTAVDTWSMPHREFFDSSYVFDGFDFNDSHYTLEELFGLLTEFSPSVGIRYLDFGTESESEVVVTQAVLGGDYRFTAEPGPELAETGPAIGAPVFIGGGLLIAGMAVLGAVAFVRPRRR